MEEKTTKTVTLEIEGRGDAEQFTEDLLAMANVDPDWSVSLVE
jgi:hypothetical protein